MHVMGGLAILRYAGMQTLRYPLPSSSPLPFLFFIREKRDGTLLTYYYLLVLLLHLSFVIFVANQTQRAGTKREAGQHDGLRDEMTHDRAREGVSALENISKQLA